MTAGQRWAMVIGATLVLWGVSERIFWSLIRPDDMESPFFFVFSLVPYLVATYCVFLVLQYFRVNSVAGVLLGGAIFGWITEGIVAMTTFGGAGMPFPISLSWTGLSWHMLISVGLFLWLHRKLMAKSFARALLFSVGAGLFWGFWSMTWFLETPPLLNDMGQFIVHAFGVTVLMIIGHILMNRQGHSFNAPKIEQGIMLAIVALYFCVVTVPTVTVFAAIIPLLALVLYIPLRRSRARNAEVSVITTITQKVPMANILTLLVMPLIATVMYGFMLDNSSVVFPFNIGLLLVTTPLGFIVLGWALWRVYRPKAVSLPVLPVPVR
jgi:hypothetical protein